MMLWLYGRSQNTDSAVLEGGTELCEDIVEEGVVLLKNEKDAKGNAALPLSVCLTCSVADKSLLSLPVLPITTIPTPLLITSLFTAVGYDWMTMAFGSGYANTDLPKVKLFPALEAAGIKYNEDLLLINLVTSVKRLGKKPLPELAMKL